MTDKVNAGVVATILVAGLVVLNYFRKKKLVLLQKKLLTNDVNIRAIQEAKAAAYTVKAKSILDNRIRNLKDQKEATENASNNIEAGIEATIKDIKKAKSWDDLDRV
ncbi:hypothetical protein LCGC14_0147410 [marine sediment metagenome]|uniref:Uncharacterized protein n=1 Tax=marine sediment metagenome TaxID=412755 RepID=A0A0F9V3Q4_9ZZZZ